MGKQRRLAAALIIPIAGCLLYFWARSVCKDPGHRVAAPEPISSSEANANEDADEDVGFELVEVPGGGGIHLKTTCGLPGKRFIVEANGSGAALLDYDGDGDLDVYIINGSTLEHIRKGTMGPRNGLFRNDGSWRFTDVSAAAGLADAGWGFGCAVGDIDNDGDPDLYVANFGANVLYENRGDGTFAERAKEAGVDDPGWGQSVAFGDVDNDGNLDIYLCNKIRFDPDKLPNRGILCEKHGLRVFCGPLGLPAAKDVLYLGAGNGQFTDASEASGIHEPEPSYGLGVIFFDLDDDGFVDIYVANDSVANFLFHNGGEGRFEEIADPAGAALNAKGRAQAGMGIACGDYDMDGRADLFVTNFSEEYNTLYWNAGDDSFRDVTARAGILRSSFWEVGWGTQFVDFDNDLDLDLYVANGHVYPGVEQWGSRQSYPQPDQLFLNDGAGTFSGAHDRIAIEGESRSSRGVAFGDLDDDGDVDLIVLEIDDTPTVLENQGGNRGGWLRLRLVGSKSPRDGTGARVWVTVGERTLRKELSRSGSYCSSSDGRLHFGLGPAPAADRIEVRWPSGTRQTFANVAARQAITIHEEKGLVTTARPGPPSSPPRAESR